MKRYCWWCNGPLVGKNGSRKPPLISATLVDSDKNEYTVHKKCVSDALAGPQKLKEKQS